MATSDLSSIQLGAITKIRIFLRLGRLEYLTHEMLHTIPAYLASGNFRWSALLAIIIACLIQMPVTSYTNYYSDQVEDRINAPDRVRLCEMVGYENIKNVAVVLWILAALWGLVFFYVANITTVLIYYLGTFIRLNYSVGLRFKRHLVLMAIPYTLSPLLLFAGPWSINQPLRTLPPVVLFLICDSAVMCCTIKNISDALGDRRAGRKLVFTEFPTLSGIPPVIASLTPFIWFSSYILLLLLLAIKVLEAKYLILLLTLPMALYGVKWMQRVQSTADKEKLFQYAFFFCILFDAIALCIFSPTAPVFGVILAVIAYSQLVSYLMAREQFSFLRFYTR